MLIGKENRVFRVTEEHIKMLKDLRLGTAVCVPDAGSMDRRGPFEFCPDIDQKRPFGNSGRYDENVLELLGYDFEDPSECAYSERDLSHARILLAQLPLAYAACMASGAVAPCESEVPDGTAWFQYQSRLALEFWRVPIETAIRAGADPEMLTQFIANARNGCPMDVLRDMAAMARHTGWISDALDILEDWAVRLFKRQHAEHEQEHGRIVAEKLMSGKYSLEYGDVLPECAPRRKGGPV